MTTSEHHDETLPMSIAVEELRTLAAAVAEELKSGAAVTPELRERFINVRAVLFQRGIYDPVLVRFDSATAPPASAQEIGEQLTTVATSLS
jgi:hypothetical protein